MSAPITPPRHETHAYVDGDVPTIRVFKRCVMCEGTSHVLVSEEGYKRWMKGEYVQTVWSDMPIGVREILVSGTHEACFDFAFAQDDE